VNDGEAEIEALIQLLSGKYAMMNFILYNAVPELPYLRPERARAEEMIAVLRQRGIIATLRDSAGQDVDGGCGQLRARSLSVVNVVSSGSG
jgi:23S rRNA (adenine2503-C2)-methyltransferase